MIHLESKVDDGKFADNTRHFMGVLSDCSFPYRPSTVRPHPVIHLANNKYDVFLFGIFKFTISNEHRI